MNAIFAFSLANTGGLLGPQGFFIFTLLLLFFGAKRLPELAKGLGQAIKEFSKAKNEITDEITRAPQEVPKIASNPVQSAPGIQTHATQQTTDSNPINPT